MPVLEEVGGGDIKGGRSVCGSDTRGCAVVIVVVVVVASASGCDEEEEEEECSTRGM